MFLLLIAILFSSSIEYDYLLGNNIKCIKKESNDFKDEYLRALCYIDLKKYEDARYILSKISTKISKDNQLLYLVFNTLIEISLLSGEYEKAIKLSNNNIEFCSNHSSYSCFLAKSLGVKANYGNNNFKALELLNSLESTSDSFFYYSLKTK